MFHEVHIKGDDGGWNFESAKTLLGEALAAVESWRSFARLHRDGAVLSASTASAIATSSSADAVDQITRFWLGKMSFTPLREEEKIASLPNSTFKQILQRVTAGHGFSGSAFAAALERIVKIAVDGDVYSSCERRLNVLQCRYKLHRSFNADIEDNYSLHLGAGDIASVPMVDIRRIGTAMSSNRLVAFMSLKQQHNASDVVRVRDDGRKVTLQEVVDTYFGAAWPHVSGSRLFTAEGLSLRPNYSHFREAGDFKIDVFEKYNPMRPRADHSLKLLRHFLKFQWGDRGRYLAELLHPVIRTATCHVAQGDRSELAARTSPAARRILELELTVHGLRPGEVAFIGAWCRRHCIGEETNHGLRLTLRIVQIERRDKYPALDFSKVLINLFEPLWEAMMRPEQNPDVAYLLRYLYSVTAVVSDSSIDQSTASQGGKSAEEFRGSALPPDSLYFYYIWSHVQVFNTGVRSLEAMQLQHQDVPSLAVAPFRTLSFRIHAETKRNALVHTIAGLLLADVVINPNFLAACCPVAYLYYLAQVPCALSAPDTPHLIRSKDEGYPSFGSAGGDAGTSLGLIALNSAPIPEHPYKFLLQVGVQVFPVSMDPLHFHQSDEPLQEEYLALARMLHLSAADTSEMCRRSVLATEPAMPLAQLMDRQASGGSSIPPDLSQLPSVRTKFRQLCRQHEMQLLFAGKVVAGPDEANASGGITSHVEEHVMFPRLHVQGRQLLTGGRGEVAAKAIVASMGFREKYRALRSNFNSIGASSSCKDSVGSPSAANSTATVVPKTICGVVDVLGSTQQLPSWDEYRADYRSLQLIAHDQEVNAFCSRRLSTLEHKFLLHQALVQHETDRVADLKELGDVYSCVKVDVHCHMASGITSRDLLEFIQEKIEKYPDDIVDIDAANGVPITLRRFFESLQTERFGRITSLVDLSVAALDVQADRRTFNRFDQFNNKYNPFGASEMRNLFLKTDNFMNGRYFAELIQRTFANHERDRNVFSEFRLSIYGRKRTEWSQLAQWFVMHGMTHTTNMFMIQIPRIFQVFRQTNMVSSFDELLQNIFLPLWEVSISPTADPILAFFLSQVSGFDTVDNEAELEGHAISHEHVPPSHWTTPHNPSYSYWMYHLWANITTLNAFRKAKGLSVFHFRPHCGESGNPDHLIDGFMLADNINHGINLTQRPVMEYLYYLAQIGLGMTPLSNNALFCRYLENPFPRFFRRGINVTLSTDGPLQFHHTSQPLIEEYAFAVKIWGLSSADVCEIARNSVLQCGFPEHRKREWLGKLYALRSTAGNDVRMSHVPQVRVAFRYEVYLNECRYIERRAFKEIAGRAMLQPVEEDLVIMDLLGQTRQEVLQQGISASLSPLKGVVLAGKSKL